ncbi:MAG TPA: hypothetical protein VGD37_08540 [Kofleriaceae bacterium]
MLVIMQVTCRGTPVPPTRADEPQVITAANLHGGGNPLDSAVKTYATFELAHKYMLDHNKLLDHAAKQPGSTVGPARYVVFAQLFWSNQSDNDDDRLHADDKAFRPDRKTGEIDMSSYKYHARHRRCGVEPPSLWSPVVPVGDVCRQGHRHRNPRGHAIATESCS